MKTLTKRSLAALIMIISFMGINSCSKDSSGSGSDTNKEALITAQSWKLTAKTISPAITIKGVPVTDMFAQMSACSQDDIFTFVSDGTFKVDEGLTKCSAYDPQTKDTGTWEFNSDKTKLTIVDNNGTNQSTIINLTSTSMKASHIDVIFSVSYTVTDTYTH